jgi:hypothetical protein
LQYHVHNSKVLLTRSTTNGGGIIFTNGKKIKYYVIFFLLNETYMMVLPKEKTFSQDLRMMKSHLLVAINLKMRQK